MIIGVTLLVVSLIYLLLTGITYYSKKRLKNEENKIYNYMVITTFIGILLEIGCIVVVPIREKMFLLNELFNRLFLSYILVWIFLFTKYIFIISFSNDKKLSIKFRNNKFGL